MKAVTIKSAVAATLVSISALAAPFTHAETLDLYPNFKINEGVVTGTIPNIVTADKITGGYVETITFGAANTFEVSLFWTATGFYADDGANLVSSQLGKFYAPQYGLYALYTGSGTYSATVGSNGLPATSFNFTPNSTDILQIWLDEDSNTTGTSPTTGGSLYNLSNTSDDKLLATGTPLTGNGALSCSGNNLCGAFGATSSLELTALGANYFIDPVPFYGLVLQSGQFNGFTPTASTTIRGINGSLDAVFAVPEPGMVGLLGLGMLAGALSRRKSAKRTLA